MWFFIFIRYKIPSNASLRNPIQNYSLKDFTNKVLPTWRTESLNVLVDSLHWFYENDYRVFNPGKPSRFSIYYLQNFPEVVKEYHYFEGGVPDIKQNRLTHDLTDNGLLVHRILVEKWSKLTENQKDLYSVEIIGANGEGYMEEPFHSKQPQFQNDLQEEIDQGKQVIRDMTIQINDLQLLTTQLLNKQTIFEDERDMPLLLGNVFLKIDRHGPGVPKLLTTAHIAVDIDMAIDYFREVCEQLYDKFISCHRVDKRRSNFANYCFSYKTLYKILHAPTDNDPKYIQGTGYIDPAHAPTKYKIILQDYLEGLNEDDYVGNQHNFPKDAILTNK